MIKFLEFLKRKVFSSVKQSVSLFEGFKGLRFSSPMLEISGDISISEANLGLVKLVVMTNVFFNYHQREIEIKRLI